MKDALCGNDTVPGGRNGLKFGIEVSVPWGIIAK